jgi:hypothetical protein
MRPASTNRTVAADRGPGETEGDAGAAGAVGDLGIGAEARGAEILLHDGGRHQQGVEAGIVQLGDN